jgi:hypothetical protein
VICVSGFLLLQVCVCKRSTDWTAQRGLWRGTTITTMKRVRLWRLVRLPQASPIGTVFAEFVFGSLHSGVSVENRIRDEGAKALGDALKDNTTLTSLLLNLRGEWLLFRVFRILPPVLREGSRLFFAQLLKGTT